MSTELSDLIALAATLRAIAEAVERFLESESERPVQAELVRSLDLEAGARLRSYVRWLDASAVPQPRRADLLAIATMLRASATVAASAVAGPRRRGSTPRPLPSPLRARALAFVAEKIERALRQFGDPDAVLALRREVRSPWRRAGESYGRLDHAIDRCRHAGLELERLSARAVLAYSGITEG